MILPKAPIPKLPDQAVFEWDAADCHPHRRGWIWVSVFCAIIFGGAIWAIFSGDWLMAFTFFLAAAVYFFFHRNGAEIHRVQIFEKGILIDSRDFFEWERFSGFWLNVSESVSTLQLEFRENPAKNISLQMGNVLPETFGQVFQNLGIAELPDRKESLLDLFIRAIRL